MADKRKKPKHTKLVLPGENTEPPAPSADRLGRTSGGRPANKGKAAATRPANQRPGAAKPPQKKKSNPAEPPPVKEKEWEPDELPDNAILLSKARKRKRAPAVYSKRMRRRLGLLVLMLVVAAAFFLYVSGMYRFAADKLADWYDSIRITVQPGNGLPADFAVTGFLKAERLGNSGYAVLGEKDMAMLSSTGREIYRIQHGYASPGLSAGNTRAVVWARGGKDYIVESRGKTLAKRTTEQDILFCEMSAGGWLAVATSSRHSANLAVYNPLYDAQWDMNLRLVDEKPILATFATDNKTIALGCLSAKEGALGTTIHILRTGSDQKLAEIRQDDARLLQAEYVSGGYLLAVFDRFAVLYNSEGEEMARRDYGGLTLQTASIGSNTLALVFGSFSQESTRLQLLDNQLEELFTTALPAITAPRVLADPEGVYLMGDSGVYGYALDGTLKNTKTLDARPVGLCAGKPPVVFTAGKAESLDGLLRTMPVSQSPSSHSSSTSGGGSDSLQAAPLPAESGVPGPSGSDASGSSPALEDAPVSGSAPAGNSVSASQAA